MLVLRLTTLVMGALSTLTALAMIQVKTALDVWWKLAGIFSGGMLGLFLLGLFVHRVRSRHAAVAVAMGVAIIGWMTFTPLAKPWLVERGLNWDIDWLVSPFHDNLIVVVGTATILVVGVAASLLSSLREGKSVRQDHH